MDDDKDGAYAQGRVPRRFYVSKRFKEGGSQSALVNPRTCRFAYQVIDENAEIVFEGDKAWELVIRETATRQQLKALFFEDDRSVSRLTFQRFNAEGKSLKRESFHLTGAEIQTLVGFLHLIRSEALDLAEGEGVRLLPEGVDALFSDETAKRLLFDRYREAIVDLVEADVDSPEIVAFARRRGQLQSFDELLSDPSKFATRRAELKAAGQQSGPEAVWQHFFEANHWIFGTGLAPQFLHAWDPNRLEQAVVGSSIFGAGKRPDAVLRSAGALSAMAFVEIKTHDTSLLHSKEYRPGAWHVSQEVAGGVAQCQATVDEVVRSARRAAFVDGEGYEAGDPVFICRPRSLLVVGSLDQFVKDGHPNVAMFESFERFRRSIRDPEIVTFDELYERARLALAISSNEQLTIERDDEPWEPF